MTPEEAREIDRLEFEADCRAARERAYAHLAQSRATYSSTVERLRKIKCSDRRRTPTSPDPDRVIVVRDIAKRYTLDGKTLKLSEWAVMSGHSTHLLRMRMKAGMTFEQAVTTPKLKRSTPWKDQIAAAEGPGVVQNLPTLPGTGGGSTTQDIP